MGVINITPNSFSDGGELLHPEALLKKISSFGTVEAIDIGAESTAPTNAGIGFEEEWNRLGPHIPLIESLEVPLSIDTYHPETMMRIADIWVVKKKRGVLYWNDVSGKFDAHVERFLKRSPNFQYIFCHNLAPSRDLTNKHLNFISNSQGDDFLQELADHFKPHVHPRVIFDPTLGFSKTLEQNWYILNNFLKLQRLTSCQRWLLGFSRKSFLRKRLGIGEMTCENKEKLDQFHGEILKQLKQGLKGELFIRTHRPELVR